MKRNVFSLAALAMTVLLAACGGKGETTQTVVAPVEEVKPAVKVAQVSVRPVDQVRDYVGTVQAEVKNNIAPQAPGRIAKIFVEVGDHVTKGQKLVQMDAANLQQLTLQIENQKVDFARIKELYAVGAVSKAEFDNMKMSLEVAETQYKNIMENTQLLSPIDGIVTARNYDNGDLYAGAAILTVEQIRPVKLMVNVSENYYSKVEKGDKAAITLDALPGETFTATVSLKYPTINASTHTFPVELTLTNKDEKVRPGMFARAQINFGTEDHVVVPDVAVVKQPGSGERFVYLYNNGKVSYVKVELGQRLNDAYELLGGVVDGATVVIAGQGRLTDGMEVRVEK
jgi:RND family efflux transporter MFP subunit